MLPFSLVHHAGYDLDLRRHVFPARKYRLIRWRLIEESFAHDEDFLEPVPASDAELLLVHSADWVRKLKTGALTSQHITRFEIPCSPKTAEAFCLATGGTILAGRLALQHGTGFNVDRTGDVEYCAKLEAALISAFNQFHPDLLVYVAGADPSYQDQLGGLSLTFDGLWKRDLPALAACWPVRSGGS
jgi:acetoin utilization deacetylase AcuC-like enzyme